MSIPTPFAEINCEPMKHYCLVCNRISPNGNFKCSGPICRQIPTIQVFDYGDWLEEIEILKRVALSRSAALYEALHQDVKVFLKVAHSGEVNRNRLIREAEFLQQMNGNRREYHLFPKLLAPYLGTSIDQNPFGYIEREEEPYYFYIFEHVEGEPLTDTLLKRPQLSLNQIGWLLLSLSDAILAMHKTGHYHYALSPNTLLVRFDPYPPYVPRPLLIDLGIIGNSSSSLENLWHPVLVPAAYTAPELITDHPKPAYEKTDVYGLGLLMYEMLMGKPRFDQTMQDDLEIYAEIQCDDLAVMPRASDLDQSVVNLVQTAIHPDVDTRQPDVAAFRSKLLDCFSPVPLEKKGSPILRATGIILGSSLVVFLLIVLAIILNEAG